MKRFAITAAALFALSFSAHGAPIPDPDAVKRHIAEAILTNDLNVYLSSGQSNFADMWKMDMIPWKSDVQIGQEYARNAIAADISYKGKSTFIHGVFMGADNWIEDSYRVQMHLFVAELPKSEAAFLASSRPGSEIAIVCEVTGREFDGFVHGQSCHEAGPFVTKTISEIVGLVIGGSKEVHATQMRKIVDYFNSKPDVVLACKGASDNGCNAAIASAAARLTAPPPKS